MKTIIKFYVLALLGTLLLTASCSGDDSDPIIGDGPQNGQCYQINYRYKAWDNSYVQEGSMLPVNGQASTKGELILVEGSANQYYEIKCY